MTYSALWFDNDHTYLNRPAVAAVTFDHAENAMSPHARTFATVYLIGGQTLPVYDQRLLKTWLNMAITLADSD